MYLIPASKIERRLKYFFAYVVFYKCIYSKLTALLWYLSNFSFKIIPEGVLCTFVFFNLARQLTVQMMQNPQILAALQERLDGLVGTSTGYIERYSICSV